ETASARRRARSPLESLRDAQRLGGSCQHQAVTGAERSVGVRKLVSGLDASRRPHGEYGDAVAGPAIDVAERSPDPRAWRRDDADAVRVGPLRSRPRGGG